MKAKKINIKALNKKCWKLLSSIQLGIYCLIALFILTIAGTLAQVNVGIYVATKTYFSAFFVYATVFGFKVPIFPGAITIGLLLLVNLIAAHITRLHISVKKAGIWLIHAGVIVLILGGAISVFLSDESQMIIKEGESRYFSEDFHSYELVLIKPLDNGQDQQFIVDANHLKTGYQLRDSVIDIELDILEFFANSTLQKTTKPLVAYSGIGAYEVASPLPEVSQDNYKNVPSAIVDIKHNQSSYLMLLSAGFKNLQPIPNSPYYIALRYKRHYNPFAIHLLDFKHERYEQSEIPSHFSSHVQLIDLNQTRLVDYVIEMNKPLRYVGKTYFQASFDEDDTISVLQVVENPGWLLPYLATAIITLGLCYQFLIGFFGFIKKRKSAQNKEALR